MNMRSISCLFFPFLCIFLVEAAKKKGAPLFDQNHPNITYLTDANFDKHVTKSDVPWLIDFYHPFCPHCKHFVPDWIKIAAYYKQQGSIRIGAVSCMDHVKCRQIGINGFPSLVAYNFNHKKPGINDRVVGTHTLKEVIEFVEKQKKKGSEEAKKLEDEEKKKGEKKPKAGEAPPKSIWEETVLPSTKESRVHDAAQAFVFGLSQAVFTGREMLEDMELDALKEWLRVVSLTFPGSFNRKLIRQLYNTVRPIPFLRVQEWENIFPAWQNYTVKQFEIAQLHKHTYLPKWQRLPDLFIGDGSEYETCALYTCGQWTMFHMMTLNPAGDGKRSNDLMVAVVATIRRFVKHFFHCVQCRSHFLEANTLSTINDAFRSTNHTRFLKLWLWKMHNSVNKRIGHPQWPKPDVCSYCGVADNWKEVQVQYWLDDHFGYVEVPRRDGYTWWKSLRLPNQRAEVERREMEAIDNESAYAESQGFSMSSLFLWYFIPLSVFGIYYFFLRPGAPFKFRSKKIRR